MDATGIYIYIYIHIALSLCTIFRGWIREVNFCSIQSWLSRWGCSLVYDTKDARAIKCGFPACGGLMGSCERIRWDLMGNCWGECCWGFRSLEKNGRANDSSGIQWHSCKDFGPDMWYVTFSRTNFHRKKMDEPWWFDFSYIFLTSSISWIMRQTEQQEHLAVFTLSERNTFSSKFYRASFYGENFHGNFQL